jgi:predicted nucleic acid-binding protein
MSRYLLDTDWIVDVLNGQERAIQTVLELAASGLMERFAQIRGRLPRPVRQQIGDFDILIAATCLAHNLTLLTRNRKDFQQIPNLKLYQPN